MPFSSVKNIFAREITFNPLKSQPKKPKLHHSLQFRQYSFYFTLNLKSLQTAFPSISLFLCPKFLYLYLMASHTVRPQTN